MKDELVCLFDYDNESTLISHWDFGIAVRLPNKYLNSKILEIIKNFPPNTDTPIIFINEHLKKGYDDLIIEIDSEFKITDTDSRYNISFEYNREFNKLPIIFFNLDILNKIYSKIKNILKFENILGIYINNKGEFSTHPLNNFSKFPIRYFNEDLVDYRNRKYPCYIFGPKKLNKSPKELNLILDNRAIIEYIDKDFNVMFKYKDDHKLVPIFMLHSNLQLKLYE